MGLKVSQLENLVCTQLIDQHQQKYTEQKTELPTLNLLSHRDLTGSFIVDKLSDTNQSSFIKQNDTQQTIFYQPDASNQTNLLNKKNQLYQSSSRLTSIIQHLGEEQ